MTEEPPSKRTIDELVERNRCWFYSHYNDLFHQYQGRFIAVSNEQVIASGRDGEKIVDAVEKMNLGRRAIIAYFDPLDRLYSFA